MKYILNIVLLSIVGLGPLKAQHSILKSLIVNDDFNGGIRIDFTIAGGNTCNGIRVFHSVDTLIGFKQVGEIPGICGDSENDSKYNFTHSSPKSFDTNYYYLEFGGQGVTSIFSHFYFEEQQDIKWLVSGGNELLIFEPKEEEFESIRFIRLNGETVGSAIQNGAYWSMELKQLLNQPFIVLIQKKSAKSQLLTITILN